MGPLYFVDLDDNLGQLKKKCPVDARELSVMAVGLDGHPSSYMTGKQVAMFTMLDSTGLVVPCTGRNSGAYSRMRLPFRGWAIISYGAAILLPGGRFDPIWQEFITKSAALVEPVLAELQGLATETIRQGGLTISCQLHGESFNDRFTPLYVEAKLRGPDAAELEHFQATLLKYAPVGWKHHRNDHTLALMPPFLGKRPAVRFFLDHVAPLHTFSVGMGDSTTDGDFMAECDYAMMPTNSQIFGLLKEEEPFDV